MLEIGEVMDRADSDEEIAAFKARYAANEITLETLEEAVEHRLDEIAGEDTYRRDRPPDGWIDADLRRTQEARERAGWPTWLPT